jgi:hypothetical protein
MPLSATGFGRMQPGIFHPKKRTLTAFGDVVAVASPAEGRLSGKAVDTQHQRPMFRLRRGLPTTTHSFVTHERSADRPDGRG